MQVMQFTPALELSHAEMDVTHREFVALLNQVADAPQDRLLNALDELITHTEAHFAQEQQWMEAIQFPPLHCHVREHEGVLEISREVRTRVAAGETHLAGVLAQAVAEWFGNHVASMDAVLAVYLKHPDQVSAALHCAGACDHAPAPSDAEPAATR